MTIDTLRADRLPCLGYTKQTMPSLCRFAQESLFFKNHYVTETHTVPSHTSLFTSLLPSQHKVNLQQADIVAPEITTLAQALKNRGYQTVWANGLLIPGIPKDQWIDKGFENIYYSTDSFANWLQAVEQIGNKRSLTFLHTWTVHDYYENPNYKVFLPASLSGVNKSLLASEEKSRQKFSSLIIQYSASILSLMEKNKQSDFKKTIASKNGDGEKIVPFMYNYLNEYRLTNDGALLEALLIKLNRLAHFGYGLGEIESLKKTNQPLFFEYEKLFSALYDAKLIQADQEFQRLLDLIKKKGLDKKSIIVVFSDHGETLTDRGEGITHDLNPYQELIHTPLIIHLPNNLSKVIETPVSSIDIFPTIFDLIGINPPKQVEGMSLIPLVEGKKLGFFEERPVISQHLQDHEKWIFNTATIYKKWKLIEFLKPGHERFELYDLPSDPQETKNLAGQLPKIVLSITKIRDNYLKALKSYKIPPRPFPTWIDKPTQERLLKTGYY